MHTHVVLQETRARPLERMEECGALLRLWRVVRGVVPVRGGGCNTRHLRPICGARGKEEKVEGRKGGREDKLCERESVRSAKWAPRERGEAERSEHAERGEAHAHVYVHG